MKVFNPNDTTHTLNIIPREYVTSITLKLRDEFTDITSTFTLSSQQNGSYLSAFFNYNFKEGSGYEITVYKNVGITVDTTTITADATNITVDSDTMGGYILYRGKAFATSQTDLQNYEL